MIADGRASRKPLVGRAMFPLFPGLVGFVTDVGFDRSTRRRPPCVWAHYQRSTNKPIARIGAPNPSETAAFSRESTVGLRCEAGMIDGAASVLRSKSGRIVIGDARTRGARRTRVDISARIKLNQAN